MHDSDSDRHSPFHGQRSAADPSANGAGAPEAQSTPKAAPTVQTETQPETPPSKPPRLLILVRHGQTTYNVENRMPGQLAGVALTDEGRRQALRAAVALSGLPLSVVVSSPLERAKDTAEIIARGWDLPVRTDPRLMDTDVGPWAGQLIADLHKNDPGWEQYVAHPNAPPPGVESFEQVQHRAVAAVRELLADESLGSYIVLVSHADVIKLILAEYNGIASESARFISITNASLSALAFGDAHHPHVLAVNWTALPAWLSLPSVGASGGRSSSPSTQEPAENLAEAQTPGGQHEREEPEAGENQETPATQATQASQATQETSEDANVRPA